MTGPIPQESLPTAAPVARLIEELNRLPGIGPKSAQRLTYHLVRISSQEARALAEAILAVKDQIGLCSACLNITDRDPCAICEDSRRDRTVVCVVEDPLDILAVERTRVYHGLYHVLHGVISPMNGVGPDDLRIKELLARLRPARSTATQEVRDGDGVEPEAASEPVHEVIMATNPNLEGEATALYLHRLLTPLGVRVTRLAQGLATGAELEYADELTLLRAFEGRRELS